MRSVIRTTRLLAAPLAVAAIAAPPAAGATFPVRACNDVDNGNTPSWTSARTASGAQLELAIDCPAGPADPYGNLRTGLAVVDAMRVLGRYWIEIVELPPEGGEGQ